jgi:pyrroloquinoline quinone biosynthesis protein B
MRIKLLGASAGGGFPQWNCACVNCRNFRDHAFKGKPRSQSQLAITNKDATNSSPWFLLNASPDLRYQIEGNTELHPKPQTGSTRHTPIGAVVLTNADLDHILGLLLMRESQPLHVYATASVRRILTEDNTMFRMLDQKRGQVKWTDILPEEPFELVSIDGTRSGLVCTPFPTHAKYPIYVEESRAASLSASDSVLALVIEDMRTYKKIAYLPGIAALDETWLKRLGDCDLVFCDGTFWTDDELQKLSGNPRTSREMGHIPMSGSEGSIELLSQLKRPRKVFTHINNTNPVLNEAGSEYQTVRTHGIEVGQDGMEFDL